MKPASFLFAVTLIPADPDTREDDVRAMLEGALGRLDLADFDVAELEEVGTRDREGCSGDGN